MKHYLLILLFGLYASSLQAQEVVTTAGSYGETTSGSLSWTVGEPVIETITDGTNTLTQGFQQSKLTVTAINNLKISGIELSVYPNPTTDYIILKLDNSVQTRHALSQQELSYQLYDIHGKLILQKKMTGNKQTIHMQNYKPATYILKIMQAKDSSRKDAIHCVSTFRIIKK